MMPPFPRIVLIYVEEEEEIHPSAFMRLIYASYLAGSAPVA